MTRGDQGMWLLSDSAEGRLPAAAREVSDVTGAGDTVIATLALALAAGATMPEAARLANEAAGVAVGKFGPATVTTPELLKILESSDQRT
jgi:D-beta-D-heptose 7-phosphate kinase/D-beta-D-heptose 1-phosphate adenosyltransferase